MADGTLHTRLLAEIDSSIAVADNGEQLGFGYHALRAVVELHAPDKPPGSAITRCIACREPVSYTATLTVPCSTIEAIADELGITEGTTNG